MRIFIGDSERRHFDLTSLTQLRSEVQSNADPILRATFLDSTFIGCVDKKNALIQHQTKLYIINMDRIAEEFFYQTLLSEFGNCGVINLSVSWFLRFNVFSFLFSFSIFYSLTHYKDPPLLKDLALLAMEQKENGWRPEDGPKDELASQVEQLLSRKREMLDDYFSLQVDQQHHLSGIPLLLGQFTIRITI